MQTPQCHQDWDRWYKKYPAAAATPRATTTPNAIFTSEESSMFLTGATMDCYSEQGGEKEEGETTVADRHMLARALGLN